MAPTVQSRVLAQARPFAGRQRQNRNIAVRAAVLEAPNAVPGELEAEAAEMKSMYSEFAELMQGTVMTFKPGDSVVGTIVDVTRKGAFVDVGGKGAAFASTEELSVASVSDVRNFLVACDKLYLFVVPVPHGVLRDEQRLRRGTLPTGQCHMARQFFHW